MISYLEKRCHVAPDRVYVCTDYGMMASEHFGSYRLRLHLLQKRSSYISI